MAASLCKPWTGRLIIGATTLRAKASSQMSQFCLEIPKIAKYICTYSRNIYLMTLVLCVSFQPNVQEWSGIKLHLRQLSWCLTIWGNSCGKASPVCRAVWLVGLVSRKHWDQSINLKQLDPGRKRWLGPICWYFRTEYSGSTRRSLGSGREQCLSCSTYHRKGRP